MNKADFKKSRSYDGWSINKGVPARVKTVDPVKAERSRQLEEHKNKQTYPEDEGDLW